MSLVSSFSDIQHNETTNQPFVGKKNFILSENGQYRIVRIMHPNEKSFNIYNVHTVKITTSTGKTFYQTVNCLREFGGDVHDCPFCESGLDELKPRTQVLVRLLVYGEQKVEPVVWSRTAKWVKDNILPYYGTYCEDNLPNALFKITRNGAKGDKQTTYLLEVLPETIGGKPSRYTEVNFPIPTEDLFAGYSELGERSNITEKSYEDMLAFVQTGQFPWGNQSVAPHHNNVVEPTSTNVDSGIDDELPFGDLPPIKPTTPQTTPWSNSAPVRRY